MKFQNLFIHTRKTQKLLNNYYQIYLIVRISLKRNASFLIRNKQKLRVISV